MASSSSDQKGRKQFSSNTKPFSSNTKPSSSYPPPPLTSNFSYVKTKVNEILVPTNLTGITKFVRDLCYSKETEDSPSWKLLYDSFIEHLPNRLALKLIGVYRFGNLSVKLEKLQKKPLEDIKNHLTSCLSLQEIPDHDFKLFSSILSRISLEIFINSSSWDELCSYIVSQIDENPRKALLIFSNLPILLDYHFLKPLLDSNLPLKIVHFLNQDSDDEEWCLALVSGFAMALQLLNLKREDLVSDMVYEILNSANEMVVKRREIVVRRGIVRVAKKVRREAFRFRKPEYDLVFSLGLMLQRIDGVGEVTKMAAMMICEDLEKYSVPFLI